MSSYFWDRATETLIVQQENAVTADVTVSQFGSAAKEACSTALPDVPTKFPMVRSTYFAGLPHHRRPTLHPPTHPCSLPTSTATPPTSIPPLFCNVKRFVV